MANDVANGILEQALNEGRDRVARSERDLADDFEHYRTTLQRVLAEWHLVPVDLFTTGAGMPVLGVRTVTGVAAVLKIALPGEQDAGVRVLQGAGDACARVLRWDAVLGALLTERLGVQLWENQQGLSGQAEVMVPLLRDIWRVPTVTGARPAKAAGLLEMLTTHGPGYGAAHPEAIELATGYAEWLAREERACVTVHGDPHPGNCLRRADGSWAFIDPDGFAGEPEYDLGVILRDGIAELRDAETTRRGALSFLRDTSDRIAALGDADPERVWRWGFVERVTTGLALAWLGYREQSEAFLGSASVLARAVG